MIQEQANENVRHSWFYYNRPTMHGLNFPPMITYLPFTLDAAFYFRFRIGRLDRLEHADILQHIVDAACIGDT